MSKQRMPCIKHELKNTTVDAEIEDGEVATIEITCERCGATGYYTVVFELNEINWKTE